MEPGVFAQQRQQPQRFQPWILKQFPILKQRSLKKLELEPSIFQPIIDRFSVLAREGDTTQQLIAQKLTVTEIADSLVHSSDYKEAQEMFIKLYGGCSKELQSAIKQSFYKLCASDERVTKMLQKVKKLHRPGFLGSAKSFLAGGKVSNSEFKKILKAIFEESDSNYNLWFFYAYSGATLIAITQQSPRNELFMLLVNMEWTKFAAQSVLLAAAGGAEGGAEVVTNTVWNWGANILDRTGKYLYSYMPTSTVRGAGQVFDTAKRAGIQAAKAAKTDYALAAQRAAAEAGEKYAAILLERDAAERAERAAATAGYEGVMKYLLTIQEGFEETFSHQSTGDLIALVLIIFWCIAVTFTIGREANVKWMSKRLGITKKAAKKLLTLIGLILDGFALCFSVYVQGAVTLAMSSVAFVTTVCILILFSILYAIITSGAAATMSFFGGAVLKNPSLVEKAVDIMTKHASTATNKSSHGWNFFSRQKPQKTNTVSQRFPTMPNVAQPPIPPSPPAAPAPGNRPGERGAFIPAALLSRQ